MLRILVKFLNHYLSVKLVLEGVNVRHDILIKADRIAFDNITMSATVMSDFQEDIEGSEKKAKKTKKATMNETKDLDTNLPTVGGDLSKQLSVIQKQVSAIVERQSSGVSPEFSALMDGYVNKANESQTYKVKYEHLETVHEDMKLEVRTLRDENRKFKSEMDASREALRLSEADLQRLKKDLDTNKLQYDEQLSSLVDEREKLKARLKQLNDEKEKSVQEYSDLKAELLEYKYKAKQHDQEKQVEIESHKRSIREANKMIDELKEKLDLRTREVEYKDALLNQLIKQVSVDDAHKSGHAPSAVKVEYGSPLEHLSQPPASEMQASSNTNQAAAQQSYQNTNTANFNPNPKVGTKRSIELRLDDNSSSEGSSWGAFRK